MFDLLGRKPDPSPPGGVPLPIVPAAKLVDVTRVLITGAPPDLYVDLDPDVHGDAAELVRRLGQTYDLAERWMEDTEGRFIRASSIIRVWNAQARVYV